MSSAEPFLSELSVFPADDAAERAAAAGAGLALFLDVDGTLIEIAATPDAAKAPPSLAAVLARLDAALGGALALVSGREIVELDRLLSPFRGCASGAHGGQWRDGGDGEILRRPGLAPELIAAARVFAADLGVIFEDKGVAFALHYRGREELADAIASGLERLTGCAAEPLTLMHGRKVFEVVGATTAKSAAVAHFMAAPPFLGRVPVMIGDDVTDLAAIDACVARGGLGLRVAGGCFDAGQAEFSGPAAVRGWLDRLAGRLAGELTGGSTAEGGSR